MSIWPEPAQTIEAELKAAKTQLDAILEAVEGAGNGGDDPDEAIRAIGHAASHLDLHLTHVRVHLGRTGPDAVDWTGGSLTAEDIQRFRESLTTGWAKPDVAGLVDQHSRELSASVTQMKAQLAEKVHAKLSSAEQHRLLASYLAGQVRFDYAPGTGRWRFMDGDRCLGEVWVEQVGEGKLEVKAEVMV